MKLEAEIIQELKETQGTRVYVFDDTMSPSDVRSNLLDNSAHMGAYNLWVEFTKETELVDPSAPSAQRC